ncbi:MAG: hypothetical protein KDI56_16660, partial [Xanthomonadales bacterium]|nr:hypothetical protein [Xanthomonadales bacterium]
VMPEYRARLNIKQVEFFEFVRLNRGSVLFSMAFLDFFDSEDRFFDPLVLIDILSIAPVCVINRHVKDKADLRACEDKLAKLPFDVSWTVAEDKQLIVLVMAHGPQRGSVTSN